MGRKVIWWLPVLAGVALAIGCGDENRSGTGGIVGDGDSGGTGATGGTGGAPCVAAWLALNADRSKPQNPTNNPASETNPRWSP